MNGQVKKAIRALRREARESNVQTTIEPLGSGHYRLVLEQGERRSLVVFSGTVKLSKARGLSNIQADFHRAMRQLQPTGENP